MTAGAVMPDAERAGDARRASAALPSRTARLVIEPLRVEHAPLLFPLLADPRLYDYAPDTTRTSVAALIERFQALERGPKEGENEVWLNWLLQRLDTGAAVGTLQATVVPGSHAWIGYTLVSTAWGQGFGTEAGAWLVADLAARYALSEIRASVDVRNVKSIALLERLGFACLGNEAAELNGEATTDVLYRLLCDPAT
jgi:RimJ/RimL family protein N-acetyltransferase